MIKELNFKQFRLSLIQLKIDSQKAITLDRVRGLVLEASNKGNANVVVLPETFNCPYETKYLEKYAEVIPDGNTSKALSDIAKEAEVYLVGGSIPELDPDNEKIYNTCIVYDPKGNIIAKHRKVHLFSCNIPGAETVEESKIFTPGESLTHFDTVYGKIGIGICYDIRFPEMASIARDNGCIAMIYPSIFDVKGGPIYSNLLLRCRAVENQMYVALCCPAQDYNSEFVSWGHSAIADPKGEIIAAAGCDETIVYADLIPEELVSLRQRVPFLSQRRPDIYAKHINNN